jgi:glutamate N-acetyltransferase / amino-acid N-acetyltransferase
VAVRWPAGVVGNGTACGIKDTGLDLGVLVADGSVPWAGVFTRNGAAAAPVRWSKARLQTHVRAVVANSGNANACTGREGENAVEKTAERVAEVLGCSSTEVLVASTGPIGLRLPVEKIVPALPEAVGGSTPDVDPFAKAILTTDTKAKIAHSECGPASIVGVAKGAAMCAPNMATMLAFIVTDADLSHDELQPALVRATNESFNRISVDGCESTNDSVFLLATGLAPAPDADEFSNALTGVCRDLAYQIVADAEGASRMMRIQITGAADDARAVRLGRAIADSALWRAALNGADPNWGRVAAALGSVDRKLKLEALEIAIGSETLFSHGEPVGSLAAASKEMTAPEVELHCNVGSGSGKAEVLTADLSARYVELNAEGTS